MCMAWCSSLASMVSLCSKGAFSCENHGAYAQLILEQVMQRTIHTRVVPTLHVSIAGSLQQHLTARSMQFTNPLISGVRDLYRILMPCGIHMHSYIIACSC